MNTPQLLNWTLSNLPNYMGVIWVGIETGASCENSDCEGIVTWMDGSPLKMATGFLFIAADENVPCWALWISPEYRGGLYYESCNVERPFLCEILCY